MAKNQEERNIWCNAIGEGGWAFGAGLGSALTVLPLLIKEKLGGTSLEVGLIAAIWASCQMFPQIFSTLWLQRGTGRKRFLIIYHWIVFTVPWLGMAASIFWLSGSHPLATRVLILSLFGLFTCGMGFIMPVWQDWIASLFHVQSRGRAFALSNFFIGVCASLAAWIAAWFAGHETGILAFPTNYAILFVGSGIFVALCMLMWIPTHELEVVKHGPELSPRQIFKRFAISLGEKNFRHLLISRLLLIAGCGPLSFFAIYYRESIGGGLTEKAIIMLGIAATAGSILGGWVMGHLGDRIGHRSGAIIGAAAQLVGLSIALIMPGTLSGVIAFAMLGVGGASNWISHANLLFETCPHDCRTAHIAVGNMVLAPVSFLIPTFTGPVIDHWGYLSTMIFCLAPTLLGLFWIIYIVREPRELNGNGNANPQSAKLTS